MAAANATATSPYTKAAQTNPLTSRARTPVPRLLNCRRQSIDRLIHCGETAQAAWKLVALESSQKRTPPRVAIRAMRCGARLNWLAASTRAPPAYRVVTRARPRDYSSAAAASGRRRTASSAAAQFSAAARVTAGAARIARPSVPRRAVEQAGLRRGIRRHGSVAIEVILRQIGPHQAIELKTGRQFRLKRTDFAHGPYLRIRGKFQTECAERTADIARRDRAQAGAFKCIGKQLGDAGFAIGTGHRKQAPPPHRSRKAQLTETRSTRAFSQLSPRVPGGKSGTENTGIHPPQILRRPLRGSALSRFIVESVPNPKCRHS